MTDQTLPPKGGWIMIKRLLPTEIQVPLLSIWYAMPDRLFPKDWHTSFGDSIPYAGLKNKDLIPLWRYRNGARNLMPEEIEAAKHFDEKGVGLDQRVRIQTPDGEVWVEPYEWTPIPDISIYFDSIGKGMILHEFGETQKTSGRMEEQIFYMGTRGLNRAGALKLLLGDVKKQNVVWLETEQEYIDFFFGERPRKRKTKERMQLEVRADRPTFEELH